VSESQKVYISVPKPPVFPDDGVWDDLEFYIFTGFLTGRASWQGWAFVFKTLNHLEIRNLDFFRPTAASTTEEKSAFRTSFIAHSIFMLNGQNMLPDRDRTIRQLIKLIAKLPVNIQDKIVEELTALNNRAHRLYPLVEVYTHETRGRWRWAQIRDLNIASATITGISGTQDLGMNHCQASYVALSRIADMAEEAERDWSNAKFIGSCFIGKQIKSIDDKDQARHAKEKEDRRARKEQVLSAYLNRSFVAPDTKEYITLPDGTNAEVVQRYKANTVEELAEQLSKALSNEKDAHDLIIEREMLKAQERSREIANQTPKVLNTIDPSRSQLGSRVISSDEMKARHERLKALAINQDVLVDQNQT